MAQIAKQSVQIEMKSSADKVYDIFRRKIYLMPTICPQAIKDVKLVKGDWDSVGSVRQWKYVAGNSETTTETVEAIDDRNKSITFNSLHGDMVNYYKMLKATATVTAASGGGSTVKWTLTYEKQNPDIPDPDKYTELTAIFTKAIDAYLTK